MGARKMPATPPVTQGTSRSRGTRKGCGPGGPGLFWLCFVKKGDKYDPPRREPFFSRSGLAAHIPFQPSQALPLSRRHPLSTSAHGASPGLASAPDAAERNGLLLAGDIGGTKTVLALVAEREDGAQVVAEATFPSREYGSLEAVIAAFRATHPGAVNRAAFSVAGPVIGGEAHITNLPWCLREPHLADGLGVERVLLLNDLKATAYALPHLRAEQVTQILPGDADPCGVRAVVAVGTGLGEAMLVPGRDGYVALPTEGGHTDFAPRNALQRRLLAELQRVYRHVSYERVCSGNGIANLYRFLAQRAPQPPPAWLAARLAAGGDVTPALVDAGTRKEAGCPVCRRTLRLLAAILGAEAGNAALRTLATGGVYLGGGIPPRILSILRGRAFREGFLQKGPMSRLMSSIPVFVILEPRAALLGAARYGMEMNQKC